MDPKTEVKIRRLQDNLSTIRKVSGWTAQQLGDEMGVTRQTVSNLELGKTPMTKTQYLALRTVLNYEIAASDNQALAQVIRALVDDPVEDESLETGEGDSGSSGAVESLSGITGALAGENDIAESLASDEKFKAAAAGLAVPLAAMMPALIPVIAQAAVRLTGIAKARR